MHGCFKFFCEEDRVSFYYKRLDDIFAFKCTKYKMSLGPFPASPLFILTILATGLPVSCFVYKGITILWDVTTLNSITL